MGWIVRKAREFGADQRGMALILVSIMLPVIIGFALLAIDMSRVNSLHNDLQKAADSFARGAAYELDQTSDAITRADRALANLVDNTYRFSDAGAQQILSSGGISRIFLASLPASDATTIDPTTGVDGNGVNRSTTDPLEARFVLVRVTPVGFDAIFPASFLSGSGADNSFNVSAIAVAGFGSGVCDFTPLYICNPYEGSSVSLADVVNDPTMRGRMIELRQQGGNTAQNSPGNYGFLEPQDGSTGANAIRDLIAKVNSPSCYASSGVEVRPGFIASARQAINVRFDVYEGSMNSNKTDANYAPATNVRKGYQPGAGNGCNAAEIAEPTTDYQRMSRDSCFYSSTCDTLTGLSTGNRVGDGMWDFDTYWSQNNYAATGISKPVGRDGTNLASNTNPPTRYDLYRYEIANDALRQKQSGASATLENGVPACSSQTPPADVDRRLIYGAIINCQEYDIGNGASGDEVPPEAFGSFFLSETVESGPDQIIRVELVDITGRYGRGTMEDFARDEVQLYR